MAKVEITSGPTILGTGILQLENAVAMSASRVKVADQNNVTSPLRLSTTSVTNYGGGDQSTNTAFGSNALLLNTFGGYNTAIGTTALGNATGNDNTAVGYNAMTNVTLGSENTAVGKWALFNATSSYKNVAIGRTALQNSTTGSYNVAIGNDSMINTTGSYNVTGVEACSCNICFKSLCKRIR